MSCSCGDTRVPSRRRSRERRGRRLGLVVSSVLLLACGPRQDANYASNANRARAAQSRGHYHLAAAHWQEAANSAKHAHNRDEALYRSAMNLMRAGDTSAGEQRLQALEAKQPPGPRSARAAFDLGFLELKRNRNKGIERLQHALVVYPNASSAARGLRTVAEHKAAISPADAIQFLQQVERRAMAAEAHELAEAAGYETARQLEASGNHAAALDIYMRTVRRYPYPAGILWENALLASAELEVQLGRPAAAIETLRFLLGHREQA